VTQSAVSEMANGDATHFVAGEDWTWLFCT